ncbi:hypothetical protein HanPI659440_Chr05g0208241 [Helianthus annuus]|nr:hypothetical protein HanPI659440_Chr05g0208241 [Helianthus annuus]
MVLYSIIYSVIIHFSHFRPFYTILTRYFISYNHIYIHMYSLIYYLTSFSSHTHGSFLESKN